MPPDSVAQTNEAGVPAVWRSSLLAFASALAIMLGVFAGDWADMASQWWNASTYNHVLLVPPILVWLVVQRWPELRRLTPSAWWPGLILFGLALLLWVLGCFAGFSLVRQAGAVALVGAAALAIFGPRVGAGLTFPLAYLMFLVPFGDELVPALQKITAELTIALTHLSGVPATVDGVFIDTPAGLFEVAEACSGIKFLIAMVALGALIGNVCFISWRRRFVFMLVCIVVPVLANAVRAWGTIFAAQYVGAATAGGIDHLIYGWFFFAIVIALVLGLSWRFFDRPATASLIDLGALERSPLLARLDQRRWPLPGVAATMAAMVLAGQAWAFAADRLEASLPPRIDLPQVRGWHRVDYRPALWWEPRAGGASHRLLGRYADGQGHEVDVFFALYSGQSDGREAGGFGQGALVPGSGWSWQGDGPAMTEGKSERLLGSGRYQRLALTWYRTGGLLTGSNMRLKLANIADRLILRERATMTLIVSAEERPDQPAEQQIAAFRAAAGPIGPWMDRLATGR